MMREGTTWVVPFCFGAIEIEATWGQIGASENTAELRSAGQARVPPPQHAKTARAGDPGACPHVVRASLRSG